MWCRAAYGLWATNNKELRQETQFAGPGEVFQRAVELGDAVGTPHGRPDGLLPSDFFLRPGARTRDTVKVILF